MPHRGRPGPVHGAAAAPDHGQRRRAHPAQGRGDPGGADDGGAVSVFTGPDEPAGGSLFRILGDDWQIVAGTEAERNTPWWNEQHAYRSYAAGPVPGPNGTAVALLTLDALLAGELAGLDLPRRLGALLASDRATEDLLGGSH